MIQFKDIKNNIHEEISAYDFVKRDDVDKVLKDEVLASFSWKEEDVTAPNGAKNVFIRYSKSIEESISFSL